MDDLSIITWTAATLAFVHTVIGADHYLPFVLLGRANRWTLSRVILVTLLCGVGHVLSSIVLGFVGVGLGIAVGSLETVEGVRGDIATWLLIGAGLVYGVWGIRRGLKSKRHDHAHHHPDGTLHNHDHDHHTGHAHFHRQPTTGKTTTVWWLFIIFVLGPCEPLIPLIMYPAANHSFVGVATVAAVFGVVTVATMIVLTALLHLGAARLPLGRMERWVHAQAGFLIAISGLTIMVLGV
jgi:ABC-type nickel/cobalt efflux system permease component RcnA